MSRFVSFSIGAALAFSPALAQTSSLVQITAHVEPTGAPAADYAGGTATSPSGDKIGVTTRYLTLNGKPWLPVMGEFHFSRVPAEAWEDEILKMKAGGVQIVSAYVIWIHHEEIEGQFDWTGQRNLRLFVELCKKHGMYVYPRIGPWAHAEVRNGGFPDWLLKKTTTRENNPAYLSYVNRYDAEIAKQLKGLLWKDGGPVIGIQLENEYSNRRPNGGAAHIVELKKLARANGMDVPLYTVTGWDRAVYPDREVLPVFGGYPDAPWNGSNKKLPPNESYLFRFNSRVAGDMGAIGVDPKAGDIHSKATPFLTAEVGGGMQDTYHRRPVVSADDIATVADVMIGSGANLLGYYMYHGGENPDGKLSTLNESRATHYATDVPVKSYDFQAPLGEFGQPRPSYGRLKLLNYFLDDFGALLAPMSVSRPAEVPADKADTSVARVSARVSDNGAFVFVSNYVRGLAMPARPNFQVKLRKGNQDWSIPQAPINLPAGAVAIWPVNIDLSGVHLNYSTAQLFCKLESAGSMTYVFFAEPGIDPEFSFEGLSADSLREIHGNVDRRGNTTILQHLVLGPGFTIDLAKPGSATKVQLLLLTRAEAESLTKVQLSDGPHLVLPGDRQVFSDGERLHLRSLGNPSFQFAIYPDLPPGTTGAPLQRAGERGLFYVYDATAQGPVLSVEVLPGTPAPPPMEVAAVPAQGIQSPPPEAVFAASPSWILKISSLPLQNLSDAFLSISYTGDVARLSAGGVLLTDNFYNGEPWIVGLKSFASRIQPGGLKLSILPMQASSDAVLEDSAQFHLDSSSAANIRSVTITPLYDLTVSTGDRKTPR